MRMVRGHRVVDAWEARKILARYPVKGLRLRPPNPVASTGGGTPLYRLDELMARIEAAAASARSTPGTDPPSPETPPGTTPSAT